MQAKQGRFRVATLTFTLGALLYILFLVLLRYDLKPSLVGFWIPIILMVAVITYQIFKYPGSEKLILFEIFLFTLLAHWETVIPCRAGAFGDDFPQYFFTTTAVMEYGFPPPAGALARPPYSELLSNWMIPGLAMYPVMIMNGGVTSMVTGVDLISISRWLPSIWSSIAILAIYILSKSLYGNTRAALLVAFGFSTYITYLETHSQYVREGIAFTMMLFAIYTFYTAYRKNRRSLVSLALLFAIATVLAHYYVTIMWIAMLILLATCFKLIDYLAGRGRFLPSVSPNRTPVWGFVFLAVIIAFAHWLYMEVEVIPRIAYQLAGTIIRHGSPTFPSPAEQATLKGEIVSWGTWLTGISFIIVILWQIIKGLRGKSSSLSEDLALAAWVGTVFMLFSVLLANVMLNPGRVPVFAYPFMLMVVTHAAVTMNKQRMKQIVIAVVVFFVVFNLFRIPFVSLNPLAPAELARITSTAEGRFVSVRYYFQQDPQGIKGADFYQDAGDAKFVRRFIIGDETVMAEPYEPEGWEEIVRKPGSGEYLSRFPGIKPYTQSYIVVDPNLYQQHDRVYNNGRVQVLK